MVISERGKELKEAVPIPVRLVAMLENTVLHFVKVGSDPAAVFLWWVLILIFASLRFNDGIHVAPDLLEMTAEGLAGMVWQTKVDRKRRGTKFAVPMASISGANWLQEGWVIFQPFNQERDFFLWDLASESKFSPTVITYHASLKWLRYLMKVAVELAYAGQVVEAEEFEDLTDTIAKLTWDSPDFP